MRRREFIGLLGGAALAWPAIAHGQKSKVARIGVLYIGTADENSLKTNLREGLRELGYVEGENVAFSLPDCPKCGSPMWPARIEPDSPGNDKRTFECPVCDNVVSQIVKYRRD